MTATRAPLCLLVDNASDPAALRRLLPGGRGHLVLVTSQKPLADLAGDGADLYALGPLPPSAAYSYLTNCLGQARLTAEPEPTDRLIALTAGVPLALWLTVAQLARHPDRPVASVVRSLLESQRRATASPTAPRLTGVIVSPHLDTAYAELSRDAARYYRYLALLPVHDIDASLADALTTGGRHDASSVLSALAAAHLLEAAPPHDLRGAVYRWPSAEVREHARQRALAEATDGETAEVLRRALGWALTAAAAADALVTRSHSQSLPDPRPRPGFTTPFQDKAAALSWLKAQAANLLALIRAAHGAGEYELAWRITWALWPWWRADKRYGEWIEIHRLALDAVQRCQNPAAELRILNTLGLGLRGTRDLDEAIGHFQQVRERARHLKDRYMEAQALHELGCTYVEADKLPKARPFLREASEIRLDLGYTRGVALTDIILGQIAYQLHDFGQASRLFSDARATLLDEDDPHDAARALAWRGRVSTFMGDIATAEDTLRAAHDEFLTVQAPNWAARTLEWLGEAAQRDNRIPDAITCYTQALDRYQLLDARDAERLRTRLRDLS
ncbi:tetratricopeptide repeat protein [Streptomyces sp. NPDC058284]|uniref:tetratricopeptide repeat protein n=1 Tax=unclassified Streptomyces TaxID=2593676 RepID=UPI003664A545